MKIAKLKRGIAVLLTVLLVSASFACLYACSDEGVDLDAYAKGKIDAIYNTEFEAESLTSYEKLCALAEDIVAKIKAADSAEKIDALMTEYNSGVDKIKSEDAQEVENDKQEYLDNMYLDSPYYNPLMPTAGTPLTDVSNSFLGCGYNVVKGAYFNGSDVQVTQTILNVDKLLEDNRLLQIPLSETKSYQHVGSTMYEYQQSIAAHTQLEASHGLFTKVSAEFNLSSSSDVSQLTNSHFIKHQNYIRKYSQFMKLSVLKADLAERQSYADPAFLAAINADDANYEEIFDTFGTHVLSNILYGGRFDLNYVHHSSQTVSTDEIEAELKATYSAVSTKVQAEVDVATKTRAKNFIENSDFSVTTVGGTTNINALSYESAVTAYEQWLTSIDNGVDLAMCDAYAPIGIWMFADSDKTEIIRAAYDIYVRNNGGVFRDIDEDLASSRLPQYVQKVYLGYGASRVEAIHDIDRQIALDKENNGLEYVRAVNHSYNLKDAISGGKFALIGYVTTHDVSKAITDITIEMSYGRADTVKVPDGYTKVLPEYNSNFESWRQAMMWMNKALTIPYVYICCGQNAKHAPIKEIGVESHNVYSFAKTSQWAPCTKYGGTEEINLNMFTGGSEEIIWVRR